MAGFFVAFKRGITGLLLLLLKGVGFLLLMVLVLFLALLLIPFCYRVCFRGDTRAIRKGRPSGFLEAKVSWLFGMLALWLRYEEGGMAYHLSLFGLTLPFLRGEGKKKEGTQKPEAKKKPKMARRPEAVKKPKVVIKPKAVEKPREEEKREVDKKIPVKPQPEQPIRPLGKGARVRKLAGERKPAGKRKPAGEKKREHSGSTTRLLWDRRTRKAMGVGFDFVFRLLKALFPKDASGEVTFGMEDLSHAGMALALLGMTMPIHQGRISVEPDFEAEENYARGSGMARGRVFLLVVLVLVTRLLLDKDVRWLYHSLVGKKRR